MSLELALSSVVVVLVCVYAVLQKQLGRKYKAIPMVTPRLPLFGNAIGLDMSRCHVALDNWSKQFGPAFRVKLYQEEILVLNDAASVHEALVVKGVAFAGRPPMYRTARADRHLHSIVWQTYTTKLQFLRKEVLKSLKMYGDGVGSLEQKCFREIDTMLNCMAQYRGLNFDPLDHMYNAVSNVMLGLTLATNFDHSSPGFQQIKDINSMFNDTFGSGEARGLDFLPWLSKFNPYSDRLQKALHMRDLFWDKELANLKSRGDSDCIVKRILDLCTSSQGQSLDVTEVTAKEVFTNLILAGTDTTATTLTCLLLVFLHHPHVQDRMWEELESHVGSGRLAELSDRAHLPYFQAVLLELLRYISHVPLAVPHYTTCDTSLGDMHVPQGMTVYINLWSLHHNDKDWPEPWSFKPERFLDSSGHLLPPTHQVRRNLMVFGAGRRLCVGEAMAKSRLFLFAAALVQKFHFLPSSEDMRTGQLPPLDPRMYNMGLVLHPKRFQLRAVARQ